MIQRIAQGLDPHLVRLLLILEVSNRCKTELIGLCYGGFKLEIFLALKIFAFLHIKLFLNLRIFKLKLNILFEGKMKIRLNPICLFICKFSFMKYTK